MIFILIYEKKKNGQDTSRKNTLNMVINAMYDKRNYSTY